MAVADKEVSLLISGNGDVLEPDDGLIARQVLQGRITGSPP